MWGGGGLKDDFEGHSNSWTNNVVALDTNPALHNGYDGTVGTPGNVPYVKEGFEHTLRSNYLVYFGNDWEYAKPICDGTGKSIMGNNSVFTTNGAAHLCGFSLADWQKMGNHLSPRGTGRQSSTILSQGESRCWGSK